LKSKLPSGLFRKLTTKLKPPTVHPRSANSAITSPSSSPTHSSTRRPAIPEASTDVAAIKRRRAALQQCGLVPSQRKDLSKLEEELDHRVSHVVTLPQDQPEPGELSTAEKIRREWQAKNETQPEKCGDNVGVPSDIIPDSLTPEPLGKSDLTRNAEEEKTPEPAIPPSPLCSIPAPFSFPDIPEEDVVEPENEKVRHLFSFDHYLPLTEFVQALPLVPSAETVDPLGIPLPDSPLSSSANLLESPSTPSLRESKRPPPIVINLSTEDVKENAEPANRGRSLNRHSAHSVMTKQSLPALSPTMTASSFSSLPTPRDEESMERMEAVISRSTSGKSRTPRLGKASDFGRNSEDLDIVHETIPESPEHTTTESTTWDPNRESTDTMGSAGFGAFVEKSEKKRRKSSGIFPPSKRSSGSVSRNSAASEVSLSWSAISNDFSLKPLDGKRSRNSTLPVSLFLGARIFRVIMLFLFQPTPTSADEHKQLTPTQSQTPIEQPSSKVARSKSVIASLGLKLSRKRAPQPAMPALPSPPPSPVRLPTAKIVENRESLLRDMKGIEDDESRRLTELAFMDF
jgi:hypothetical protein